jgi:hypothetical protein
MSFGGVWYTGRMPDCEIHDLEVDDQGLCKKCWDEIEDGEARADQEYSEFLAYNGDSYLVDSLIADGLTREAAEQEVKDPTYLALFMELIPDRVLKDRVAREALIEALRKRDNRVLWAMYHYGNEHRPEKKKGPRPNPKTGLSKKAQISMLREQGHSLRISLRSCTETGKSITSCRRTSRTFGERNKAVQSFRNKRLDCDKRRRDVQDEGCPPEKGVGTFLEC